MTNQQRHDIETQERVVLIEDVRYYAGKLARQHYASALPLETFAIDTLRHLANDLRGQWRDDWRNRPYGGEAPSLTMGWVVPSPKPDGSEETMKKQKLTATTPYGAFTRTTGHRYTWVSVVASTSPAWIAQQRASVRRTYGANPPAHIVDYLAYLDRLDAAAAEAAANNTGDLNGWHHTRAAAEKAIRDSKQVFRGIFPVDGTQPALPPRDNPKPTAAELDQLFEQLSGDQGVR